MEMILLNSGRLELAIDRKTGAIRRLTDLRAHRVLAESSQPQAFILEREQNDFSSDFQTFTCQEEPGGASLCWQREDGVSIHAQARVRGEAIAFTARAEGNRHFPLCSLEYPLINGIKSITGDGDYLAHAYATGLLIQNPHAAFEKEGDGLRHMPYPESFSGASMQFFTYYAQGLCGLYFAAEDGAFYQKWLNFYKSGNALRASQIFGYEDIGPGKPVETHWDFLLQATEGNDWYEAAGIYKTWALNQVWCRRGRLQDRPPEEKAGWLLENTGAVTFGVNGMHDRAKWVRKYRQAVGAPLFHVTGPDWPRVPQTYGSGVPGGYPDWFPTRFHPENVKAWQEEGGHFAPFEFDFLVDPEKGDSEKLKASLQKWPENPKSHDGYRFHMLCPLCAYTQQLHVERDRQAVRESGADAMYYDISANNILKTCMAKDHGHPAGAGREMTRAYRKIYDSTRRALTEDRGKYIPLGTEMINETLIDVLDFYQARANAQPCSALELWPYRTLLRLNRAWLIPLFQYVYAGYAPVRMDGWGKLTAQGGDLIYHTIAKTYLWGGLFEINSEYSPMEVIDDAGENSSQEHYCALEPRGYAFDETIGAYLRKFASLRTGPYGRFLAYGEMLRPPRVACESVSRTYLQYNLTAGTAEQNTSGAIARESLLVQAYRLNGETAVFLANTTAQPQQGAVDLTKFSNTPEWLACLDYTDENQTEKVVKTENLERLTWEPYQVMVLRCAAGN